MEQKKKIPSQILHLWISWAIPGHVVDVQVMYMYMYKFLSTRSKLKESVQSQLKQKVFPELDKYWSNQLNNKAVLKAQVVEFQEKYPWAWTTPWNSSGWLTAVLHPLEQPMSTLKQSKQKNCMFIHTFKMLLEGNASITNVNSHSK